jgi:hypothetical protein
MVMQLTTEWDVDHNCVASSGGRVRRWREWMKSEVEVGARAFASDRNHGACHWLSGSPGELHSRPAAVMSIQFDINLINDGSLFYFN